MCNFLINRQGRLTDQIKGAINIHDMIIVLLYLIQTKFFIFRLVVIYEDFWKILTLFFFNY